MPNTKKILIFIEWYKPGYKAGGPIRSISNLVDHMCQQCELYIITTDTDYLTTTPYPTVKANEWKEVDGAKVYYLSQTQINKTAIKKLILEVHPDVIYCNSLYSKFFTLIPIVLAKKMKITCVLAVRGMLSPGSLGVKSGKKKVFLTLVKLLGTFKNCIFHATNQEEEKDILRVFGKNVNTVIAQNLPEKKRLPFFPKQKTSSQLQLIFVGRIAPEKNILYAIQVLSKVKAQVQFDIYGPVYNEAYWKNCQKIINLMPSNIVVNYKGSLPHNNLEATLKKYQVLFLPSTGENFGHIIIEAMHNSCIPIISDQTPWKNLNAQKIGYDLPLKEPSAFAETIDKLALMESSEITKIAQNAHEFAIKTVTNEHQIDTYIKLFQLNN